MKKVYILIYTIISLCNSPRYNGYGILDDTGLNLRQKDKSAIKNWKTVLTQVVGVDSNFLNGKKVKVLKVRLSKKADSTDSDILKKVRSSNKADSTDSDVFADTFETPEELKKYKKQLAHNSAHKKIVGDVNSKSLNGKKINVLNARSSNKADSTDSDVFADTFETPEELKKYEKELTHNAHKKIVGSVNSKSLNGKKINVLNARSSNKADSTVSPGKVQSTRRIQQSELNGVKERSKYKKSNQRRKLYKFLKITALPTLLGIAYLTLHGINSNKMLNTSYEHLYNITNDTTVNIKLNESNIFTKPKPFTTLKTNKSGVFIKPMPLKTIKANICPFTKENCINKEKSLFIPIAMVSFAVVCIICTLYAFYKYMYNLATKTDYSKVFLSDEKMNIIYNF